MRLKKGVIMNADIYNLIRKVVLSVSYQNKCYLMSLIICV